MSRVISFEYLNRQLVWQELSVWFCHEGVLDYPVPFFLKFFPGVFFLFHFFPTTQSAISSFQRDFNNTLYFSHSGVLFIFMGLYDMELALFLLPLVNAPRIQALIYGIFSSLSFGVREPPTRRGVGTSSSSSSSLNDAVLGEEDGVRNDEVQWRGDSSCVACQARPATTPYSAQPCEHVYCYYCIRSRCKLDAQFKCLVCNQRVHGIRQNLT